MTEQRDTIDHVAHPVQHMREDWKLPDALLGGTRTMRDLRKDYLPQEPKEQPLAYENRVRRSVLFNAYKAALNDTSAKPFARPVTLNNSETLPESLELIADDVDGRGTMLTPWARETFKWALHYGIVFVLVDMPVREVRSEDGETRPMTLEEFRTREVHPLFKTYRAKHVLGWRTAVNPENGQERLTQIRFHESATREEGDYVSTKIDRVRVITETEYIVFEKVGDDKEFAEVERGEHTFGRVPVFAFDTMPGDIPFTAEPALGELAWVNLLHWQSMSDQRNILRFARTATLYAIGFEKERVEEGFALGPNQVIASQNPDAKVGFAEHSGAAIKAGEDDLRSLEERMTMLALRPFVQRTGNATATGKAIDESRSHTMIEAWVRGFETFLRTLYSAAAEWVGAELPDDFTVDIASDFAIAMRTADDIDSLIKMREKRMITQKTFLSEIKARGLLNELLDVSAEIEELEREDPFAGEVDADDVVGATDLDDDDNEPEDLDPQVVNAIADNA